MFFNSWEYIVFFFCLFLTVILTNSKKGLKVRNLLLLAGSYFFYAQLHYWFVLLLIYTTAVNYLCGKWIAYSQSRGETGKKAVTIAVILSLAILIVFKYAYVFDASILLPVGLSFFTFQALTYTIDIYRKKINAESSLLNVALFIAFFPTLLSGPIERARNLIPQLKQVTNIYWNNVVNGAGLFIWGLFKKVVIADRLAEYVNMAYSSPETQTGSTLALAAVFYSFQIYCDFSGYADMAVGSGSVKAGAMGLNMAGRAAGAGANMARSAAGYFGGKGGGTGGGTGAAAMGNFSGLSQQPKGLPQGNETIYL